MNINKVSQDYLKPEWIKRIFYTYLTWLIWSISILTNLNLLWLSSQTKLIGAPTENWTYYTIFCLPSSLTIMPRRGVQGWSCKNKTLFRKWYFVLTIARKKILAFKKNTKLMPTDRWCTRIKIKRRKIKTAKMPTSPRLDAISIKICQDFNEAWTWSLIKWIKSFLRILLKMIMRKRFT